LFEGTGEVLEPGEGESWMDDAVKC
jgi:hypothetical protein